MSASRRDIAARLTQNPRPKADKGHPRRSTPSRNQGRVLCLNDPEPWWQSVDGQSLADDLAAVFERFVALPPCAATALVLWTLHAHAHDAADVSPLLVLSSAVKRCGKTTTLRLLQALVPRELLASNISTAALFRTVEEYRPTLLVDEGDSFLHDREELRGILNSGHLRDSARVVRAVGDDFEPRVFSTWAPKAIALIGRVPATVEDRAIVLTLRRRAGHEPVERLRIDRRGEFEPLRQKASRWARDTETELRSADPQVPASLHDRAADNWRPLLAIAEKLGGDWPRRAVQAALTLSGAADEADATPSVQLLADLKALYDTNHRDRLSSAEIVRALVEREDGPWAEWKAGRPLTQTQLARLLKPFGVQPRMARFGSETVRGYYREDLEDAFSRYLLPEAQQAQQASIDAVNRPQDDRNSEPCVAACESRQEQRQLDLVAGVAGWEPVGREEGVDEG